jgi:uncharacterized protein (DUF305 family)
LIGTRGGVTSQGSREARRKRAAVPSRVLRAVCVQAAPPVICACWYPVAAGVLVVMVACRSAGVALPPPLIQPGAPGEASRPIDPGRASDMSGVRFTQTDVQFMQGMIGHHAQAIEMTALLKTSSTNPGMQKLAQRIEVSQDDEIHMMREWLQARSQELPNPHAHHMHGARLMPGMLTAEEMARLAAARGVEFDRLFLEFMIKHHLGALAMVDELFAQPGAGQESDIFAFASDVVADQRMEIERMAVMLKELQK